MRGVPRDASRVRRGGGREAAAALADVEAEEGITEMGVALAVTERLPPSDGLFLGNSMPIRDVDALAGIFSKIGGRAPEAARRLSHGWDPALFLRRGDARGCQPRRERHRRGGERRRGYASGLGRPVTLLIGDVSFQHDANGLLLLRERPGQPR